MSVNRILEILHVCENNRTLKFVSVLVLLSSLLVFLQSHYEFAFSQTSDESGMGAHNNNLTTSGSTIPNQTLGEPQRPSGFVANGIINTVITVPNGKWLATGNWSIILNNGTVTSLDSKMTWYNSSGTNAHTHELTNFRSTVGDIGMLPMNGSTDQISIKGHSDVGTNGQVSWFEVPTTIAINDRKIISISLDTDKTNNHFGEEPLLGIVESFVPCSDVPGPNMELLPPCSNVGGETDFGNYGSVFPPPDGYPPFEQGFPSDGQFPPFEDQSGQDGQFPPFEDQSGQFPPFEDQSGQDGQFPPFEDQSGQPEEDQSGQPEQGEAESELNPDCVELEISNITANGFETDPSDYHPPFDAIDGDSSTWWSNNETGSWVELDLGRANTICGLAVEWNKGDSRDYSFKIEVSQDGNDYQEVFEGSNEEGSSAMQIYPIDETEGRYIKLTVTDTSSNQDWVSIKEIKAMGIPMP